MRVLLVYYSKTGNTAAVAKQLEAELRDRGLIPDVARVRRLKEAGFLACATEARRQQRPEITGAPEDLSPYDLVFLGFPTWGFCAASPVNSLMARLGSVPQRKFCLFASSGFARGYEKGLEQVTRQIESLGGTVVASAGFPNVCRSLMPQEASRLVSDALKAKSV